MTEDLKARKDRIPEGWRQLTLDDIKSEDKKTIITGPFGSNIGSRFFVSSGIPVIRGNNLSTDMTRFVDDDFVFIASEKAEELDAWALRNDIVFTAAGTLGQVGIIEENSKYEKYIISNKQMRVRVNRDLVRPLFAFYWFSSPKMVKYIQQRDTGSTIPLINLSVLRSLPIVVPPIDVQDAIVKVLDSLDSKIKLNRKLNATLEHIGKVIFKRWFVDFEFPNEKGKPYKSNGGEMENSEMGRIPRGWRVSTIGKELSAILGGTPDRTRREYWENGDVPWINSGKVNEFRITEPAEYITREGLDNSATKLLPKRTTVLAITGATLGQVSLLEIDSCANQSVVGILASEKIPSEYIYFWTKHIIGDIISWQTGGAQQHINKENVNNSPLLIPDNHLLSKYSEIVKPIFDRITSNCFENSSLSRIRDFLLPKLMSGEIRVNPAKAESEART